MQNSRFVLFAALLLAACGPSVQVPTATPVSVEAVYTAAAQTLQAQLTSTQAALPTETPIPPSPTAPLPSVTPAGGGSPTATLPPLGGGATQPVSACNSYWLSDVTFPDNTLVFPGQTITKTWKVKNTGTCTWTANFRLVFISGEAMGGSAVTLGKSVTPGEEVDISVPLTVPNKPGQGLNGNWRLQQEDGVYFGTFLTVVLKVAAGTFTLSPTPTGLTVTPSQTPTLGVTATPSQTPTETPSQTPAETPTP